MAVWGTSDPISFRLFNKSVWSHYFEPKMGYHVPHYFTYTETGFPAGKALPNNDFYEGILNPGEFLFIPWTHLASFDVGTIHNLAIMRDCFADASNLLNFREIIAIEAKISKDLHQTLKQIDTLSFDFAMNREPSEQSFLPKKLSDSKVDGNQNTGNIQANPAGRERRNRGNALRGIYAAF
jgi:hypothetical protein